jgi:hypothetical protein
MAAAIHASSQPSSAKENESRPRQVPIMALANLLDGKILEHLVLRRAP